MLYVSCAGAGEILRFAMDRRSGELTLCGRTPLPGPAANPGQPSSSATTPSYSVPLAVSPHSAFLYAVLRTPPFRVLSYRVDPATGELTYLGEAEVPDSTPYIRTDRSGRYLFGAAYQGNCLWLSAIGPDGCVGGEPIQTVEGIDRPHCVVPHSGNRTVYVAAAGGDELRQFRFDPEGGRLTPLDPPSIAVRPGTGPRHLALHPVAEHLYCINETVGTIDLYAIDAVGGGLTPIPGPGAALPEEPSRPAALAADLHISPDGRFLYGSERAKGTISAFAIDPQSGALSYSQTSDTDRVPRSFAIDPSGRFLVAAGQDTGRVAVHAMDPASGRLTDRGRYEAAAGPSWVEIIDLSLLKPTDGRE